MRAFARSALEFLAGLMAVSVIVLVAMAVSVIVLVALGWVAPVKADECSVNTPLSVWGQNGSNGLINTTGSPGYSPGSVVGQITNDLTDLNGTANLHGTAKCANYGAAIDAANKRLDETTALSAALSTPIWLEPQEKFAVSGGLGFAEDATAFGATGLVRLDKNWSAFAGGAMSTENSDTWAGKLGARVGW